MYFDKLKKPFFIAEMSGNHNGTLSNAKKLINHAKKYGADAIKLQTYTPDTMTLKSRKKEFLIKRVYGKAIIYGLCLKKQKHHLVGIKNYLIMLKKKIFYVSVLLSAKTRLIF